MRKDINIVIGLADPWFVGQMFGDEEFVSLPANTTMLDILTTTLPVFSSKSQARKAGWGEVPEGFSQHQVGKLKHRLAIVKGV